MNRNGSKSDWLGVMIRGRAGWMVLMPVWILKERLCDDVFH